MGAAKTAAGDGKSGDGASVPGNSGPRRDGDRSLWVRIWWLVGIAVGVAATGVAICTVVVYGNRVENLRNRMYLLEQRYLHIESSMRSYVDGRLRDVLGQVSLCSLLFLLVCVSPAGNRQPIPMDRLPAVRCDWLACD